MEAHRDKFSEDKIVCLARVFTNIEFLGCKYPPEVMTQVKKEDWNILKLILIEEKIRLQRSPMELLTTTEDRGVID